ncbi:MAG TPA: apolipoprotein N-acyltransferase [Polyangiaceae bacterium]|nr:apolipoprotein N-acyltransferase [Polyangiaceae bacterium]
MATSSVPATPADEAPRASATSRLVLTAEGLLPLSAPVAYAAAIGSGLLYWLAFPGVDLWPLTFLAWVPLVVAIHRQPTRRALLLAWTAGLTMNVAGFFWLQKMLETFSGFPAPICFFFVLVVCAYQGGRIGLLGWIYGRATARGWPSAPAFVGAFVTSELAYPLLFPWYYGATVHDVPQLTQLADIGGPIAVGVMLVLANLALAQPILALAERRKVAFQPVIAGALAVAFALIYGSLRIRSVDTATAQAPAATVGIVQANMGLMEKRTDFEEGMRRHLRMSEELRERGADFLVWSETSAMHAVRHESYRSELRGIATRIGLPTVFGAVVVKRVPDQRDYVLYNSAVSSQASGAIENRYDKEYLLMFGEYLPFGGQFPILYKWSPNSGRFTPGTSLDPLLMDVRNDTHRITALICYEDILPSYTNDAVRHADPDLLVNLTNDAWFLDTAAPWEHFALTQMRAVEHRRYLVRGTNSGVSGVIDPVGRVVTHSGTFRQEALLAPIHWMHAHTVYETICDWPWRLTSLLVAVAAFRKRPVRSSSLA